MSSKPYRPSKSDLKVSFDFSSNQKNANTSSSTVTNNNSNQKVNDILAFIDKIDAQTQKQELLLNSTQKQYNNNVKSILRGNGNSHNNSRPNSANSSNSTHNNNNINLNASTPLQYSSASLQNSNNNSFVEIKHKMLLMKDQLTIKDNKISELESSLKQLKDQIVQLDNNHQQIVINRQKEFESHLQRQLKTIEQLLTDKAELNSKLEEFALEQASLEKKYTKIQAEQNEFHQQQLKQQQANWEKQEKLSRENWIKEQKSTIKKMTIKGLEPEIEKILKNCKAEIAKKEEENQIKIQQLKSVTNEENVRVMEQVKQQFQKEKELALEHERHIYENKLKTQLDLYDAKMSNNRIQLLNEVENEKTQLIFQHKAQINELNNKISESESSSSRRLENALRLEREKFEAEKESFHLQYINKFNSNIQDKLNELRKEMASEQEKQLETIINKLTAESMQEKLIYEKQSKQANETIKHKYNQELREKQLLIEELNKRYNNLLADYNAINDHHQSSATISAEKDQLIARLTAENNKLNKKLVEESVAFKKQLQKEIAGWQDKYNVMEINLNRELNRTKENEHKFQLNLSNEINQLECAHDQELLELNNKIRLIVEKKDTIIEQLQHKLTATQNQLDNFNQQIVEIAK